MTDIVQILSDHRHIAVPLLILLMAAESAPLVGFFIPGVLILPALGAMTGTEIWPFWHIYFSAVAGALLGDILGYWLARSGRAEWTYRLRHHRYQQALKSAERLVGGRGALALALGRFAWFIHPAVPPAAGLLGVRPGQFFLIDTLATCLWVWVYLGLGHVVTGAWLEKSEYLIGMTSLLAVTILVIVLIQKNEVVCRATGGDSGHLPVACMDQTAPATCTAVPCDGVVVDIRRPLLVPLRAAVPFGC